MVVGMGLWVRQHQIMTNLKSKPESYGFLPKTVYLLNYLSFYLGKQVK